MEDQFAEISRPIYRFLLQLSGDADLAQELAQESLAHAWQRREQLRAPEAFRTWIFRIAANVWNEHCRRSKQLRILSGSPHTELPDPHGRSPEQHASDSELGTRIWHAMNKLPQRQRQVFHLRVVEGLAIDEIAEILAINSQCVRSNLSAARGTLRNKIKTLVSNDLTTTDS